MRTLGRMRSPSPPSCHCEPVRTLAWQSVLSRPRCHPEERSDEGSRPRRKPPLCKGNCGLALPVAEEARPLFLLSVIFFGYFLLDKQKKVAMSPRTVFRSPQGGQKREIRPPCLPPSHPTQKDLPAKPGGPFACMLSYPTMRLASKPRVE